MNIEITEKVKSLIELMLEKELLFGKEGTVEIKDVQRFEMKSHFQPGHVVFLRARVVGDEYKKVALRRNVLDHFSGNHSASPPSSREVGVVKRWFSHNKPPPVDTMVTEHSTGEDHALNKRRFLVSVPSRGKEVIAKPLLVSQEFLDEMDRIWKEKRE